jgi:hypothetical protein
MAFVRTDVNYAAEYSRALSNAYPYMSYFGAIWGANNSNLYRPGMGKTMYIPSMTVKGSRAVNRDQITGTFERNWNNEFTPVTLEMDREWDTLVDPMDIDETNDVATIANITRTFNELQKIPEMDAYLAAKLHSFVTTPDTTTLTAANILEKWDTYLANMTDARVNRDRVEAYMTPAIYKLLKEAAGITRFVSTDEGYRGIDRNVARLDGVRITEVPSDIMKTAFDFSEGFAPAQTAKQINLIMVDPLAVAAPVKYETSMMSAPTAQSKGKYLYYERYYYGAFAMPNRAAGIIANSVAAT